MILDIFGIRYFFENVFEIGEVIEVVDGVLWFCLLLLMVLDYVNIYVLDDGDGWIIIDIGFDMCKICGIWNDVIVGLLGGKLINRVIVIYFYFDYIGFVGWFVE